MSSVTIFVLSLLIFMIADALAIKTLSISAWSAESILQCFKISSWFLATKKDCFALSNLQTYFVALHVIAPQQMFTLTIIMFQIERDLNKGHKKLHLNWQSIRYWTHASIFAVDVRFQIREQVWIPRQTLHKTFFCKMTKWAHLAGFRVFEFFCVCFQRVSGQSIGSWAQHGFLLLRRAIVHVLSTCFVPL